MERRIGVYSTRVYRVELVVACRRPANNTPRGVLLLSPAGSKKRDQHNYRVSSRGPRAEGPRPETLSRGPRAEGPRPETSMVHTIESHVEGRGPKARGPSSPVEGRGPKARGPSSPKPSAEGARCPKENQQTNKHRQCRRCC